MNTRVLSVLMWKHAVVRARRFSNTVIEFVFPLMFFLLLFLFRNELRPPDTFTKYRNLMANTVSTDIPIEVEFIPPPYWIMYYPETMLTNSLMDEVGAKLNLKRLNSTSERGYFPLSDLSRLTDLAAKMKITEAIIIFHDMEGESWPTHLNYTIRMKVDFKTETYEPLDYAPGPNRMFGFKYITFMRIQWAVDTSYINLVTGDEVYQALSLQEFPYYNKGLDQFAGIISVFLMPICYLSLLLTFMFLMIRLLQERASGIQELMKMFGVSPKLLGLSHVLNVLPCALIFSIGGAILLTASSNPLIKHSSGILIFLMLLLYYNTIVSFAFACSYIPSGMQYGPTLANMAYIFLYVPSQVALRYKLPYIGRLATGFFPHMPMCWFWIQVGVLETYDDGLSFSNMTETHNSNSCSVLLSYIFMLLQTVIGYFLTWYLSYVRPGQYGQALPWYFLFKREPKSNEKENYDKELNEDYEMAEYESSDLSSDRPVSYKRRRVTMGFCRISDDSTWCYSSDDNMKPRAERDDEDPMTDESLYFEPPPAGAVAGIKVVKVSKVYPKHRALSNVSLNVYKGEITVLLGHNGAGKTTLMSIITGMTSATEGKVFIHGKDTVTQQIEVRKHLGLCPQHNLFFDDLTVREHIMFFRLLKQGTFAEARKSASKHAEQLNLSDKLNSLPSQLSGGMKRRVQLACALTGGADVLVLDEPTSGLDVETRRELWNLLLSLRSERTVLLTTHFMEEADALGDRVAALHAGVLRCFATPMYLKKAMGSGYRLVLTTIGTPKKHEITKVVRSKLHNASVKEQTINSISYNLPAAQTVKFPGLFSALEAKKSKLGIDSIGVGVSSLDEVFLKLCSDIDTTLSEDEVDNVREPEVPPNKITGVPLYMRQLCLLLKRQIKYVIHKKWVFLFMQILLPIYMIIAITYTMNVAEKVENPVRRAMNLDLYGDQADSRVMYHVNGPVVRLSDVDTVKKRYPKVAFQNTDDVATAVLRTGQKDIFEYNKYLIGMEINETDAKILYTTIVRHAAPVALNLLSNILAAQHMPWADGRTITTMNDPVNRELRRFKLTHTTPPKAQSAVFMWGIFMVFILLATNINNVSLPSKERQTNSRHIHVMSGCPPELHWLATFSFHTTISALTLVLPVVVAVIVFEENETTNQPDMLATFALILLLGSMSFSVFSYLVSFNFEETGTNAFLGVSIIVFAVFTPLTKLAQELTQTDSGALYQALFVCNYIVPPHTMVEATIKCLDVARLNAKTKLSSENPRCYLCWNDFSPAKNMTILLVQILVMLTMVFLTERGFFNGLLDKVMNMNYRPKQPVEQDEMVRAESAYVSKAITLPTKQISDAMLVHDLHKNYKPFCSKSVNAVRGISFSVKKGECFGLLGINGAGKSSTFKMLTAEESATRGNIFGNGYHLKRGNAQYLQTLGYCPQFFGLDMFLTGQENLELILTLRGFDKQRVKEEVRNWIHIVGLEKYAQRRVDGYSGGCVRRLSAAAALCSGAELALLDEPSAGVDVAARRRLWTALRRALRQKRSIIITSHSMDEMEALCSRIAILAAGRVRVLGTAHGLRSAHAHGHAVVLKLVREKHAGEMDATKSELNRLKRKFQKTFDCTLKDEHRTMLHYHINQTMRYSYLFTTLESLRTEFHYLIEDYSITETTLEEVFLSIAKEQHTGAQHV